MQTQTKQEKTKVCTLDLSHDLVEYLQQRFDVFDGSLGKRVKAVYSQYDYSCRFLLNYNLPGNIHEYEIFIEDMDRNVELDYIKKEHTRTHLEDNKAYYFYCNAPQTIFNPICYGSSIFSEKERHQRIRPTIKIVFASDLETVHYIISNANNSYDSEEETKTNHEHLHLPQNVNICGTQVRLTDYRLSSSIFQSFLNDIRYHIAFDIPYKWNSKEKEVEDGFYSLLETPSGAVLSFVWIAKNDITIVLPQTSRKKELLQKVFEELLFPHFSEYFPEVAESAWIKNSEYYLPGQSELIQQKEALVAKYEAEIADAEKKIELNNSKYAFLHKLLTATGDELVKATIQFLRWLGFTNVIDKDTTTQEEGKPLEEDIQVDLGQDGLLVIEVKGIGGTSTDAECSQIHKIVFRRIKERGTFDVHGLYIANNELHKEPLKRTRPPFTPEQIEDAVNDDRGLAYTWQFFNLFFAIEDGIITKDEARKALFGKGQIQFYPSVIEIGIPYNYFRNHTVACMEIGSNTIKEGEFFYYMDNDRWNKVKILSVQKDKNIVKEATNGKFGFGLEHRVPNNVPLYIKR